MRRPLLFSFVFSCAYFGSFNAGAQVLKQTQDISIESLLAELPAMASIRHEDAIEARAAEFFERSLRLSQAKRIEADTASAYRQMEPKARAEFRNQRRRQWKTFSERQKSSLRSVKTPQYRNLSESQQQLFRNIAARQLGAGVQPSYGAQNAGGI